jgi:hypothetical protein
VGEKRGCLRRRRIRKRNETKGAGPRLVETKKWARERRRAGRRQKVGQPRHRRVIFELGQPIDVGDRDRGASSKAVRLRKPRSAVASAKPSREHRPRQSHPIDAPGWRLLALDATFSFHGCRPNRCLQNNLFHAPVVSVALPSSDAVCSVISEQHKTLLSWQ